MPDRVTFYAWVVAIACALLVLPLLAGCRLRAAPAPKIDPSPTLAGQVEKDRTVLVEADRIDAIAPEARPHTDAQRAAVAAAPAADVVRLVADYVRQEERNAHELAVLKKQLAAARKELAEIEASIWRKVQFYGALGLYGAAIGALVLAALRAKAAISTGMAVLDGVRSTLTLVALAATCFTVARFMAASWFWWGCAAIVVAALAYVGYLAVMERRGKAAANALTPIRKVLDRVYDEAAPATKAELDATIFTPLSDEMKAVRGAKAYIHLDRALVANSR